MITAARYADENWHLYPSDCTNTPIYVHRAITQHVTSAYGCKRYLSNLRTLWNYFSYNKTGWVVKVKGRITRNGYWKQILQGTFMFLKLFTFKVSAEYLGVKL
jgi:hypothetical protein